MKKLSSLLVLIFCLIPFVASAWILRDEFNTALSAGSVNNTTSEPSGHTRTVIDTENKLSIADGKLTFSGGKALNDPGMKYPGITTQQGTVLLSCLSTFTSGITYIGLNNDNEIDKTIGITPNAGKWFSVEFGDDLPLTITSFPSCLAVTFSQLGHMWFGKDGESAYWKLGRVDKRTLLAATVYPVFGGHSLVGTFDFLRIPNTLWLPTPLASDGFSVSGTTDGKGHAEGVAGGIGSGGGGLAWQSGGTTWSVSGGKAVNTPLVYGEELIVNGDMETGNPPSTWRTTDDPVLTVEADRSGAGSQSLGATISSGHTWMQILQSFTTETGKYYKLSVYSKAQALISTKALFYRADAYAALIGSNINKTGDWAMTTMTARALSKKTGIIFESDYTEPELGKMFLDDVSVKELKLSELFNTIQSSTPDVISTVTLPINPYGTQQGMVLNLDSVSTPLNFVVAYYSYNRVYLDKCVNGTWTNIITNFVGYVENAELRVIKDGTTYRLYYNNALVGTATISDASIINNTRHGLFSTDAANTLDNFTLYARGTGNEYNILNQLMSTTVGGSLNLLGVGK